MTNRTNRNDKTGRTFWDYSHDNPKIVISLIVVLALLVLVLLFKDYSFKSPYISMTPNVNGDSVIIDRTENVKPKEQEIQKGLTSKNAVREENPKSPSKFEIKGNEFKAPTQIGDNNIQNIDTKQRAANDSIISAITANISDKNQIIIIDRQDQTSETNIFSKSLMTALKAKGFKNVSISLGVVMGGGTVWVDDPERTMREQRWFRITEENNEIHLQIPLL